MRLFPHPLLALALGLLACDGPAVNTHSANNERPPNGRPAADSAGVAATEEDPGDYPDDQPNQPEQPSSTAMQNAAENPATGAYRLIGLLDPDMGNTVAYGFKVPREWQVQQSFKRRWVGAQPFNDVYISLRAPNGRAQIEYLPARQYVYSDGPMSQDLRAQKQAMGMPTQMADNELAPMPAAAYVQRVLLPQLAQNGLRLSNVGNEQEAPRERDGENMMSRGSVDGTLPNGHRVRVECRLSVNAQQQNGDTFYTWNVTPSITQTADDLEAAYAHTRVAQESVVRNPTWVQRNRDLQMRGAQANSEASRRQHEVTMGQIHANTDAMTAAHNARMGDIQRQGAANTARYNERMAAMDVDKAAFDNRMASGDRQQEIRVDAIRGESKYVDPTTGQRSKVEDGYNHVYQDRQNPTVFYGSNTPIDAGKVDWQELQKVSLKDY